MTTNTKMKEFLEETPSSNRMWLTQQLINELSDTEMLNLSKMFEKLDDIMVKSWAKEMTFLEILNSIRDIKSMKE
jgi:hypothetical protein